MCRCSDVNGDELERTKTRARKLAPNHAGSAQNGTVLFVVVAHAPIPTGPFSLALGPPPHNVATCIWDSLSRGNESTRYGSGPAMLVNSNV
jgi:hypothetical protein